MRATRFLTPIALGTLALLVATACKSSDGVKEPAPGECVSRDETYTSDMSFAVKLRDVAEPPECFPTCGEDEKDVDGFLSVTALPAGKCNSSDRACSMGAYRPCPCDRSSGPVDGYRCECIKNRWACTIQSQGASACPSATTCDDDAG